MTTPTPPLAPALACDLTAIAPDERDTHLARASELLAAVLEVRELPDGYALRLPVTAASLRLASEYLANERLCCPFFHFTLEVEPNHGPVWFRYAGPAEVKPLLAAEMGPRLAPAVAEAAGFPVASAEGAATSQGVG